jgi:hypothetical protein
MTKRQLPAWLAYIRDRVLSQRAKEVYAAYLRKLQRR